MSAVGKQPAAWCNLKQGALPSARLILASPVPRLEELGRVRRQTPAVCFLFFPGCLGSTGSCLPLISPAPSPSSAVHPVHTDCTEPTPSRAWPWWLRGSELSWLGGGSRQAEVKGDVKTSGEALILQGKGFFLGKRCALCVFCFHVCTVSFTAPLEWHSSGDLGKLVDKSRDFFFFFGRISFSASRKKIITARIPSFW